MSEENQSQAAPDTMPHILVVDDDDRLRDLLKRYLTQADYTVLAAKNAADARAKLALMAVDLIVLDVMMPGMSGIEFARELRRTGNASLPILLLTAKGEAEDRIAGLEAGADDYLAKPFEPRELLLRISAVLRRASAPPPARDTALKLGRFRFDLTRLELLDEGGAPIRLSDVEASLLAVLAANPGKAFSRDELSSRSAVAVAPRSVDVQVTRLRRKIEDDPKKPRLLQTARGHGYSLRPE
jgi:two-component system phosphate regulon response regulator OmpR